MNDFSFSENSLAGVPAEGLREEAFSPRLQLEDAGRVTGLEPYGEISHQSFKTMDMVEPPPPVGSGLDFKEALAVYDTLEDGPARVALSNELDKWERRQALENYSSPLGGEGEERVSAEGGTAGRAGDGLEGSPRGQEEGGGGLRRGVGQGF